MADLLIFIGSGTVLLAFVIIVYWQANAENPFLKFKLPLIPTLITIAIIVFAFVVYFYPSNTAFNEAVRNIILALGGLGAFYGLVIASERQKTFSKQIDNAQEQLFNERLGRAVELLAHDNMAMNRAGLRTLSYLSFYPQYYEWLILEIIFDHFDDKANPADGPSPGVEVKRDPKYLSFIAKIIYGIYEIDKDEGILDEFFKGRNLSELDLKGYELPCVYFNGSDLTQTHFNSSALDGSDFTNTTLYKTQFLGANLSYSKFSYADFNSTNFSHATLRGASFNLVNRFNDVHFHLAELYFADFTRSIITRADFTGAYLNGMNCTETDFEGAMNIHQGQLNTICYERGREPINLPSDLTLPESRAFEYVEGEKRFIKSDDPWSEQWVEEWVKKEIQEKKEKEKRLSSVLFKPTP